jgi:hypothetical protein
MMSWEGKASSKPIEIKSHVIAEGSIVGVESVHDCGISTMGELSKEL